MAGMEVAPGTPQAVRMQQASPMGTPARGAASAGAPGTPQIHAAPPTAPTTPARSISRDTPPKDDSYRRKYQFEYQVGLWTFGDVQVVKARDTGVLRTCKSVPKTELRDRDSGAFRAEVFGMRHLRGIQHPHVCSLVDIVEDGVNVYLVTEFCGGGDLAEWLARLTESNRFAGYWLDEQTAANYVKHALIALAHCHEAKVYHRDLRPSSLFLTSRLPDAEVKVSDFGLAPIIDPGNLRARRSPSPFNAPELLTGGEPTPPGAPDLWSVGVLAYVLLCGQLPYCGGGRARRSPWRDPDTAPQFSSRIVHEPLELLGNMSAPARFAEEEWAERSAMSQDLVRRLLRNTPQDRPTAAQALQHPWLRGPAVAQSLGAREGRLELAPAEVVKEASEKSICYLLAILMVPILVPHRDFEDLRFAFQNADSDGDGFATRAALTGVLQHRNTSAEVAAAALTVADVPKTDVLDLCGVSVADLIAREFCLREPGGAASSGGMRPKELVPRMTQRFFEVFDKQQRGVGASDIRNKIRTATASDIELYAGVQYDEMLGNFPEGPVDPRTLTKVLAASSCRGTPLGVSTEEAEPTTSTGTWGLGGVSFNLDVMSMFRGCGEVRRDDQEEIRIDEYPQ